MDGNTTIEIEKCLAELKAGDPQARNRLISIACERLRKLTRKILYGEQRICQEVESDDLLNDALIQLMKGLDEIQPNDSQHFFRLASQHIRWSLINLARKVYGTKGYRTHEKGMKQDSPEETQDWNPPARDSSFNPFKLMEWTEVHEKAEQLPEKEKEAFDLLYYQGLTQNEAADLMGVSSRSVRNYWALACRRLKRIHPNNAEEL